MTARRRRITLSILVLAVAAVTALPALAEDIENRPVDPDRDGRDGSGGAGGGWRAWARMILALAVVVALVFALRWAVRRFGRPFGPAGGPGPVRVLARAGVSPRQELLLVRMGRRILLIGAGADGLTALAEATDPEEIAELEQSVNRQATPDRARRENVKPDASQGNHEPREQK